MPSRIKAYSEFISEQAEKATGKLRSGPQTEVDKDQYSIEEQALTGGARAAYNMGMNEAKEGRPKKDATKSFGMYAKHYHAAYDQAADSIKYKDRNPAPISKL